MPTEKQITERLDDLKWISLQLSEYQKSGFYGEVILKFQAGKLMHIGENKTLLPPSRGRQENP